MTIAVAMMMATMTNVNAPVAYCARVVALSAANVCSACVNREIFARNTQATQSELSGEEKHRIERRPEQGNSSDSHRSPIQVFMIIYNSIDNN